MNRDYGFDGSGGATFTQGSDPSITDRSRGHANLSRSAVSRYIQLATLFRRRIEAGTWLLGQQIPTIDVLVRECGVARSTIRQALDVIEAEGLIERLGAKGTYVTHHPQDQRWCNVETDWEGSITAREGEIVEILADALGDYSPAHNSVGNLSCRYRRLQRRHWMDGKPYLIADVFIGAHIAAKLTDQDLRTKTALRLVEEIPDVRVAQAHQTLTMGTADIETATLLNTSLNAPVCHATRTVIDQDGAVVLVSNGIYRGEVIRIDTKLR